MPMLPQSDAMCSDYQSRLGDRGGGGGGKMMVAALMAVAVVQVDGCGG